MLTLTLKRMRKFEDIPICGEEWLNLKSGEEDHPIHTCIGHTCNTRHHCSCGAGKETRPRNRKKRNGKAN